MRYRHYKGGLYEHVCVATLESDLSEMIVYRAPDGSIWTRPRDVFFQLIDVNGALVQRFTPEPGPDVAGAPAGASTAAPASPSVHPAS
jgi:hypothetical protein